MEEKLKNIIRELKAIQLAEIYLGELKSEREAMLKRKTEIEKLNSEKIDTLNKLNKKSPLSIYFDVVGKKSNALEITKQYYFNLAIEYNELLNLLDETDFEINVLKEKVEKFEELKLQLKEALVKRDEQLSFYKEKELFKVVIEAEFKIGLIKELEEAIESGAEVKERFETALTQIIEISKTLYKELEDEDEVLKSDIRKLENYQIQIIRIKHSMLKFEAEVNDIYKLMFNDPSRKVNVSDNFLGEHRINLFKDLKEKNSLLSSYGYLKNQQNVIEEFLNTLGEDLRNAESDLEKLEEQENQLISQL